MWNVLPLDVLCILSHSSHHKKWNMPEEDEHAIYGSYSMLNKEPNLYIKLFDSCEAEWCATCALWEENKRTFLEQNLPGHHQLHYHHDLETAGHHCLVHTKLVSENLIIAVARQSVSMLAQKQFIMTGKYSQKQIGTVLSVLTNSVFPSFKLEQVTENGKKTTFKYEVLKITQCGRFGFPRDLWARSSCDAAQRRAGWLQRHTTDFSRQVRPFPDKLRANDCHKSLLVANLSRCRRHRRILAAGGVRRSKIWPHAGWPSVEENMDENDILASGVLELYKLVQELLVLHRGSSELRRSSLGFQESMK